MDGMEDGDEIVAGSNRLLHKRRKRRNLFGKARKELFLEHLAATCNVTASAEAAGVAHSTVYANRMRDDAFRSDWALAIEQGYARLEAALIERALNARTRIAGNKAVHGPDSPDEIDWDKGMDLLRHHQKAVTIGQKWPGGTVPQRVPIDELTERLVRKLKAIGVRLPEQPNGNSGLH